MRFVPNSEMLENKFLLTGGDTIPQILNPGEFIISKPTSQIEAFSNLTNFQMPAVENVPTLLKDPDPLAMPPLVVPPEPPTLEEIMKTLNPDAINFTTSPGYYGPNMTDMANPIELFVVGNDTYLLIDVSYNIPTTNVPNENYLTEVSSNFVGPLSPQNMIYQLSK